ncbi:MAG TPA: hypothetical protein PLD46_03355 [Hyphomicrobium sp.]|nr:hypothetical protein [Hyphomicrobium sp.]
MTLRFIFAAVPAALFVLSSGSAIAAKTVEVSGTIACVNDKWDEKEPEKGHKFVEYAGRCVKIPSDPSIPKVTEACVGNYEYLPDGTWKGSGTCTSTRPGGDTTSEAWEEGSHLKAWPYTTTGGTGKYQGASGGGTYFYENLTDTLSGGTFKGKIITP